MGRNEIKEALINMMTSENESIIINLLKSLEKLSDEELHTRIERFHITEDNLEQYLSDVVKRRTTREGNNDKFINVNEFFCYGRIGNTIHMHLIPKDLRGLKDTLGDDAFYAYFKEQLEDFLSRLQTIVKDDGSIETIFAVSPIFFNPHISAIHEDVGFDKITEVDLNNHDDNMSPEQKMFFLNMFNTEDSNRKVYYTKMDREKFLNMKYSQISDEDKHVKD